MTVTLGGLSDHASGRFNVTNNGHILCAAAVSAGVASCSFAVNQGKGTHSLVVHYKGDGNHLASNTTVDEIVQ